MARSRSPGGLAAVCAAAALLHGCGGARWHRVEERWHVPLLALPDRAVGMGLARTPGGWAPRACFDRFETVTSGGVPRIELRRLGPGGPPVPAALRPFAEEATAAAGAGRREGDGQPPVVLLLTVSVSGQRTSLVENTARLREDAARAVADRDVEAFLRLCGTEVVVSTLAEGRVELLAAWAPRTAAEGDALHRAVAEALSGSPEEVTQLGLLDRLPFGRLS